MLTQSLLWLLTQALKKLGVQKAFVPDADFSAMTEEKRIYISHVVHKARSQSLRFPSLHYCLQRHSWRSMKRALSRPPPLP